MQIEADRRRLDTALDLEATHVLVMVGGAASRANLLHEELETGTWDKRHIFAQVLSRDHLTEKEREAWFDGKAAAPADCFVMLRGRAPKSVLMNGRVDELFLPNTDIADFLRIRNLFVGTKYRNRRLT